MENLVKSPTSETIAHTSVPQEKKIPVVELFGPTIEGEGRIIGTQTFFIRFGLCDYKCRKCDSMHAVDPNLVKALAAWKTQDEIYEALVQHAESKAASHIKNVTFSGGNPAIHDLSHLVSRLKSEGWTIFVETQGTKCPNWLMRVDEIVCSPKSPGMGEVFDREAFSGFFTGLYGAGKNVTLKVVVFSAQDLEFAASVFSLAADLIAQWTIQYTECSEASAREVAEKWLHSGHCYLSLGNPYPPEFTMDFNSETGKPEVIAQDPVIEGQENNTDQTNKKTLVGELLSRYNQLSEEMMKDPRLSFAKLLPQLHVLVWGNETGR